MLAALPGAVRRRVLRRAALGAGVPSGALAAVHIAEVERLVTEWRGQGRVDLPGKVGAVRRARVLTLGGLSRGSAAKERGSPG
nr:TilS substrate-binding domain-containing protein [Sinosporangium siamense]